jgi:HAD superfamily hydrolase (TIGR01509 family)
VNRALIFDCDGVLSDTERDGHLVAFNRLFAEQGLLDVRWSPEHYAGLLRIGGGKERMHTLFGDNELVGRLGLPRDRDRQAALIAAWHRRKTEIFRRLVSEGRLPGRPGVVRLAAEAQAAGWQLAVASTAAKASVRSIVEHVFPPALASGFKVFAGDAVKHKKPAPDVYLLALSGLGRSAGEVCVLEDSAIGLRASLAASCPTLITVSGFTADEDFSGAGLVVDSLGDESHPVRVIDAVLGWRPRGLITLGVVESVIKSATG